MSIKSRSHQYGKVFDHWQIKEFLGQGSGGKSAVFRLDRIDSSRGNSALKVINLIEDRGDYESFSPQRKREYDAARKACVETAEQEVWLMNALQGNTNIVDYLDHTVVDWSDETGFGCDMLIRMELLEDLRGVLRNNRIYTESEIIKIAKDICTALILCHKKGILHRDIKPENIFINKDENYKLGDFGVSRILSAAPMAMASTSIGTPEYAAPEQFSGKHDKRVDIYSLGLVLYELANGNRLPFADSNYVKQDAIQRRQLGEPLPAPSNASQELSRVILKACAFHADDRYQTAQEFMDAICELQERLVYASNTVKKVRIAADSYQSNATYSSQESAWKPAYETTFAGDEERADFAQKANRNPANNYASYDRRYPSREPEENVQYSNTRRQSTYETVGAQPADNNQGSGKNKNAGDRWIVLAIAAMAICVVALVIIFGIISRDDKDTSESNGEHSETEMITEAPDNSVQNEHQESIIETEAPGLIAEVSEYGMVEAGYLHSVRLWSDGTVRATGANYPCEGDNLGARCDVDEWEDIVKVSAYTHTVGLRKDGTVVAVGYNNHGQCEVYSWSDIVDISAGHNHTLGLMSDGTVVAVGLNASGQCDVSHWRDIVAVAAGANSSYGLRSDGTVVMAGDGQKEVNAWRGITAIEAGYITIVGLKADGTVANAGFSSEGESRLSKWRDIIDISTDSMHTVGLRDDGTVVALGSNDYGQCDVYGWRDIVDVSAGTIHTLGLRADGTVVTTGNNMQGQCDIGG